MRAHARLAVARDRSGRTRIDELRSDPPMTLRPIRPARDEPAPGWNPHGATRVSVAASAAGPVGGDELRLDIEVGVGATLVVDTVAAALALPGPYGRRSRTETIARVAEGGTLVWLPEPVIAARGCDHHATTRIHVAADARLLAREELILGRHDEAPGIIRQRLRVTCDDDPLHDQEISLGGATPAWDGPAVTGGRGTLGSVLVADPAHTAGAEYRAAVDTDTAVLPLDQSTTLITALARDALTLRQRLDDGLAAIHGGEATAGERAKHAPTLESPRTRNGQR